VCELKPPNWWQLENLSKTLAESKGSQMEVPGQYLDAKEPLPTQHVKVDRVLPDVEMADLNLACHRKIVIRGNDSKVSSPWRAFLLSSAHSLGRTHRGRAQRRAHERGAYVCVDGAAGVLSRTHARYHRCITS
jgi:hypothetical protein